MINILMSGNYNVKDGLMIVVLSYLKHNTEPVTFYFETMDLHTENPKFIPVKDKQIEFLNNILKKANPESSIIKIDCTEIFLETMSNRKNIKAVYTPYTLLRLLSDKVSLPDKILYLDTDVMILDNIEPLYNIDLEDYEFAACVDYLGQTWIGTEYQNAGVMLMNMKRIRETGLMPKCRDFIVKKQTMLLDQDALNKMELKKKFLPFKFNEQHKKQPDTIIRHFSKTIRWTPFFHTQNVKPWNVKGVHEVLKTHVYDDVLDEYVKYKDEFAAL